MSMSFLRQEYWSGLLFPSPGDLPDPGIELRSPTLQADSLLLEPQGNPDWTLGFPLLGCVSSSLFPFRKLGDLYLTDL